MGNLINNYINGNLPDAKKQARRFSHIKIREALERTCGYSFDKSAKIADYLKNKGSFQTACDAE